MEDIKFASLQNPEGIVVPLKAVGKGGGGQVFRGRYITTGQLAAIKVIDAPKKMKTYIEREINLLRKYSQHENIVSFYGAFRRKSLNKYGGDKVWVVLEFCGGGSISDLLHRHRPKEDWIAYICRGILRALAHLHANRVIHRDVKALNVMLTEDAEVKLVDFGLCVELDPGKESCNTYTGTPLYMAPEVIACKTDPNDGAYDCRSDVWSCGITAIQMATGVVPHKGKSRSNVNLCIVKNPAPRLNSSTFSEKFTEFIESCLVKDYRQRPSAEEMLDHPFIRDQPDEGIVQNEIKQYISDSKDRLKDNIWSGGTKKNKESVKPQQKKQGPNQTFEKTARQQAEDERRLWDRERDHLRAKLEEEQMYQKALQEQVLSDRAMFLADEQHRKKLAASLSPPLLPSNSAVPPTPCPVSPTATRRSRLRRWLNRVSRWFTRPSRTS